MWCAVLGAAILSMSADAPRIVPEDNGWGFKMEIPWAEGPVDEMAWQSLNGSLKMGEKAVTFESTDQWTSKRVVGEKGVTVTVPVSLDRRDLVPAGRWTMDIKVIDSLSQEGKWTSFGPVTVAVPPLVESYPLERTGQKFLILGPGVEYPRFEDLSGETNMERSYYHSQVNLLSVFHESDGSSTYLFDSFNQEKLRLNSRRSLFAHPGLHPLVIDQELLALREELIGRKILLRGGGSIPGGEEMPRPHILGLKRAWRPQWVGEIWSLGPIRGQVGGFFDFWAADAADLRSWIRSE
jgi:hypothetical protein